jgi:hypothetical protein
MYVQRGTKCLSQASFIINNFHYIKVIVDDCYDQPLNIHTDIDHNQHRNRFNQCNCTYYDSNNTNDDECNEMSFITFSATSITILLEK